MGTDQTATQGAWLEHQLPSHSVASAALACMSTTMQLYLCTLLRRACPSHACRQLSCRHCCTPLHLQVTCYYFYMQCIQTNHLLLLLHASAMRGHWLLVVHAIQKAYLLLQLHAGPQWWPQLLQHWCPYCMTESTRQSAWLHSC